MTTITDLISEGYRNWNEPSRLAEIGAELESRSRLEQARVFLKRAIELAPKECPNAYHTLSFTYFRDVVNHDEEGENTLIDGIEATGSDIVKSWYAAVLGDESIVAALLSEVGANSDASSQFALAGALHWRGRNEEALEVFRNAAARVPLGEPCEGLIGYCSSMIWMRGQGENVNLESEVLPRINDLLNAFPNRYAALTLPVQYYQVKREWENVASSARRILEIMPDEETTMLALAIALRNLNDNERAIIWANRAIGAKYSFVRARIVLSGLYEKTGARELALEVAREIPIANPKYAAGKAYAADILKRLGHEEEAVKLFREGYKSLRSYEKSEIETRFADLLALAKSSQTR